jgi:hypothetical protein
MSASCVIIGSGIRLPNEPHDTETDHECLSQQTFNDITMSHRIWQYGKKKAIHEEDC